jgi:GT2 family glycosyltransferase
LKNSLEPNTKLEILVLDLGNDGTAEWILRNHPDVEVYSEKLPCSFARSNNLLAKKATGDILLVISSDVVCHKGFLETMLKEMDSTGAAIVGPQMIWPPQAPHELAGQVYHAGVDWEGGEFPSVIGKGKTAVYNIPFHIGFGQKPDPQYNTSADMKAVAGACFIITKDVYRELGGFDEKFINCYEDIDLCIRATMNGHKIRYCGSALVEHWVGGTKGTDGKQIQTSTQFWAKNIKRLTTKYKGIGETKGVITSTMSKQEANKELVVAKKIKAITKKSVLPKHFGEIVTDMKDAEDHRRENPPTKDIFNTVSPHETLQKKVGLKPKRKDKTGRYDLSPKTIIKDSKDPGYTTRLLIGTATTGNIRMEWHAARMGIIIPTNWSCVNMTQYVDELIPYRYQIADAQNIIVKAAVSQKFEWLLLLEHDVCVPPDTFIRLNEYMREKKVPVVSGLYYSKSVPPEPMIYKGRGNSYATGWKFGDKVWVDGVPTGLLLVHMSILKAMWDDSPEYNCKGEITRRVFETPRDFWYDPATGQYNTLVGTSDLDWCTRIINGKYFEKAGWPEIQKKKYPILCDTGIFARQVDDDGTMYPY